MNQRGYVVIIGKIKDTLAPVYIGWVNETQGSIALALKFAQAGNPNELGLVSWVRATKEEAQRLLEELSSYRVPFKHSRWYARSPEVQEFITKSLERVEDGKRESA